MRNLVKKDEEKKDIKIIKEDGHNFIDYNIYLFLPIKYIYTNK